MEIFNKTCLKKSSLLENNNVAKLKKINPISSSSNLLKSTISFSSKCNPTSTKLSFLKKHKSSQYLSKAKHTIIETKITNTIIKTNVNINFNTDKYNTIMKT